MDLKELRTIELDGSLEWDTHAQNLMRAAADEIDKLRTALAPFADYGSGAGRKMSKDMQISKGSNMAKRQIVMGDFHDAADAMGRK